MVVVLVVVVVVVVAGNPAARGRQRDASIVLGRHAAVTRVLALGEA